MDVIETRVSFYSMLRNRGKEIYSERLKKVFGEEELTTKWRDSQLKHNDKLVLRDPPKFDEVDEESDEDGEEGEDEMFEEGGEDELEEMPEEAEAEMKEAEEGDADGELDKPQEEEKDGEVAPTQNALFSNKEDDVENNATEAKNEDDAKDGPA